MKIGYVRISKQEQNKALQIEALHKGISYLGSGQMRRQDVLRQYAHRYSTILGKDVSFLRAGKKWQIRLKLRCSITLGIQVFNAPEWIGSLYQGSCSRRRTINGKRRYISSLYCRQPQLVSGQSRNRWLRKCRSSPRTPLVA